MERNDQPKSGTMAPAIKFHNDGSTYRLEGKRKIAAWIEDAITSEGFVTGDINYIFCSPENHIRINREYLGHDYYTDVITFDYVEDGIVNGDIFIDPETVKSNAAEYSATFRNEMLRVVIHGILHLCGYKDKTVEEEKEMRSKEDLYLKVFHSKHSR